MGLGLGLVKVRVRVRIRVRVRVRVITLSSGTSSRAGYRGCGPRALVCSGGAEGASVCGGDGGAAASIPDSIP